MCHRFTPLSLEALQASLVARRTTGRASVPEQLELPLADAYPGSKVAVFVPDATGELHAKELTWGFNLPSSSSANKGQISPARGRLVYNTRIETALSQVQAGRGMWARYLKGSRCLVPVRAFYEWRTVPDPATGQVRDAEGKRQQMRFTLAGHSYFLLAGVASESLFSVITTAPTTQMSRIHTRMPLVLLPGESRVWLGDDYASLADRLGVELSVEPERTSQQARLWQDE